MSGTNKPSAPISSSSRPETTAPVSREILLALICLSRCRSKVSSNPSGLGGVKVCSSIPNGPWLSPQLRDPPRQGEAAPVQGGGAYKAPRGSWSPDRDRLCRPSPATSAGSCGIAQDQADEESQTESDTSSREHRLRS